MKITSVILGFQEKLKYAPIKSINLQFSSRPSQHKVSQSASLHSETQLMWHPCWLTQSSRLIYILNLINAHHRKDHTQTNITK